MATPLAHSMAGIMCIALLHISRPQARPRITATHYVAAAMLGCAPDIDIAYSMLLTGSPSKLHFGWTHSFFFAVLAGLVAWALGTRRGTGQNWAILALLAVSSHVIIDWFTGPHPGMNASFGIKAFWPLDEARYSMPVTLFQGVKHGNFARWLSAENLQTLLMELIFFTPLTIVLVWWAEVRRSTRQAAGAPTILQKSSKQY